MFRNPISRFVLSCIFLCLLFFWPDPVAMASSPQTPSQISVVYCKDIIPFHYTGTNGTPEGILIDFWNLWSRKTGITIQFTPATWDDTLTMMREGKADAHAGLFFNENRARFLDYGVVLHQTDTHIFYDKRLPPPSSNLDFLPYRVGMIRGDSVEGYLLKTFPHMSVEGFNTYKQMMAALKQNRLSVFAADTPTALFHLQQSDLKTVFKYKSGMPLYRSNWHVAVKKGNQALLTLINNGFQSITEDEKRHILRQWASGTKKRDNGALIIAASTGYAPFSFIGIDGNPAGLLVDIWRLWSRQTNTPVIFKMDSWAQTLEAVNSGEADIHSGLFKNQEREKWLTFGMPIFESDTALYFLSSRSSPATLKNLKGDMVGAMTGSYQEKFLKQNSMDIQVVGRKDNESLILSLIKGEISAFVHEAPVVSADLSRLHLSGLISGGQTLFSEMICPGVAKGRDALKQKIDNGFLKIPIEDLAAIEKRWLGNVPKRFYREAADEIGLTSEQKKWIRNNPVIKVAATPNWPPFEFNDKGKYSGLHADMIRLTAQKAGLEVKPVFGRWSDLVAGLKSGELDLCPGLNATEERKEYLVFTDDTISETSEVIVSPETAPVTSIKELRNRKVATVKGYATETFLKENFPDVNLVLVDGALSALKAVVTGKADAYLGNQAVALYLIKKDTLSGLKVTAFFEEAKRSEYRIGIIDEKPVLRDILQKALAAVTVEEVTDLQKKWFGMAMIRSEKGPDLKLTDEQNNWIKSHPDIRVASALDLAPFEFKDENGRYAGITADIFRLAAQRSGLSISPVFEKQLQSDEQLVMKQVDVAACLTESRQQEDQLLFSDSFATAQSVIWTRTETRDIISRDDLAQKTVVTVKGCPVSLTIKKQYPDMRIIEVDSTLNALKKLSQGQADAYIGTREAAVWAKEKNYIDNIQESGRFSDTPLRVRLATRKDLPILHAILQKALDSITQKERTDIIRAYISASDLEKSVAPVALSSDQRAWLRNHSRLNLAVAGDCPPFELMDSENGYGGIVSEYVNFLGRQLDVEMVPALNSDWPQAVKKLAAKEIDILPKVVKSKQKETHLLFTKPYLSFPVAVFGHKNSRFISGLNDLKGLKIAVTARGFVRDFMSANHPELPLTLFSDTKEALMALSKGAVDVFINDTAATSYTINALNIPNLNVAAMTPINMEICMGVRKDLPQLIPILEKAMETIPAHLAEEFKDKWLSTQFTVGLSLATVLKWGIPIAGGLGLIILVIFIWNRKLDKEITARKRTEKRLSFTQYAMDHAFHSVFWINPDTGQFIYVNKAACKILGYDQEQLLEMVVPQIDMDFPAEKLEGFIQMLREQDFISTHGRHQTIEGAVLDVELTCYLTEYLEREVIVVFSMDITQRLRAQRERDEAYQVIKSSIEYASRIQRSVLPPSERLDQLIRDHFVLWQPRDVVGGDIYWCRQWGEGTLVILADCTGHGVPGAFMTLISSGALDRSLQEVPAGDPAALVQRMHQLIQIVLGQDSETGHSDDGLELGLCYIHPLQNRITFAGAGFPLFKLKGDEVDLIKGEKIGIGYRHIDFNSTWTNHNIEVIKGDRFYMSSDGIFDQIGGPKRMGFGKKRFKKLLLSVQNIPLTRQGEQIYKEVTAYQGKEKRRDDIAAIGFQL